MKTSTKILLLGGSALVMGSLSTRFGGGKGLASLGHGTTEFLLSPGRAAAESVELIAQSVGSSIGVFDMIGGSLANLKNILDDIFGVIPGTSTQQLDTSTPEPESEAPPPAQIFDAPYEERVALPTSEYSQDEICSYFGTDQKTIAPRIPCIRVRGSDIQEDLRLGYYTRSDVSSGRIGVPITGTSYRQDLYRR